MPSRRIDDLRPVMQPRARAWLAGCQAAGLDVLVYCTLRTMPEQADLYAQGRTRPGTIVTYAKPGQSAHNHGLAFDFCPLLGGKPQWRAPSHEWLEAVQIAEQCGLESASKWQRFKEWPHLQLAGWRDFINGPLEAA